MDIIRIILTLEVAGFSIIVFLMSLELSRLRQERKKCKQLKQSIIHAIEPDIIGLDEFQEKALYEIIIKECNKVE